MFTYAVLSSLVFVHRLILGLRVTPSEPTKPKLTGDDSIEAGKYHAFWDDDREITKAEWDEYMRQYAAAPAVGVVASVPDATLVPFPMPDPVSGEDDKIADMRGATAAATAPAWGGDDTLQTTIGAKSEAAESTIAAAAPAPFAGTGLKSKAAPKSKATVPAAPRPRARR